jgi:hypothetical protein
MLLLRARELRICRKQKMLNFLLTNVPKVWKNNCAHRCLTTHRASVRFQVKGIFRNLNHLYQKHTLPPAASLNVDKMFLSTIREKVPLLSLPRERKSGNAGKNIGRPRLSPGCEILQRYSCRCLLAM